MLLAGGFIERHKYLGYRKITDMASQARGIGERYLEKISQQYSRDSEGLPFERDVDSALLPLKIRGVRLSEHYATPKTGGAIAVVGRAIIVLDRLGNFYSYRPGKGFEKLSFPPLPNNIAEYAGRSDAKIDGNFFRVHNVKHSPTLKLLAVSHEFFDPSTETTRMAVSVIGVDESSLTATGSWETIYRSDAEPVDPNPISGGTLAFAKGDRIYLTIGDYWQAANSAQDPASSFGKILEISIATRQVRKVTLGHRNPQGLTVTKDGHLLSTEQGVAGGDELNDIIEGSNYGWPKVTLGTDYGVYDRLRNASDGRHEGYKKPMFAWLPSVAVSKLIQVDGFHPRWDGDLLAGSLKGQTLFRLRLDGLHVLYSEPIYIGQRIRDLAQMADGTIAVWTDDTQLLFVTVDRPKLAGNMRYPIHDTLRFGCMSCHHFGPTSPFDGAPSLSNLLNRKIASDSFRYSAALRGKGDGVWTEENLRKFLADTSKFASGTTMPTHRLSPDEIDEVIVDLAAQQGTSR
jgi:aldose sugar dehydrogenase